MPESAVKPISATATLVNHLWAAHPLSKLLPIDWGGITQALTELSLRRMADPAPAMLVAADLGFRLWRDAAETWLCTMAHWSGSAPSSESSSSGGEIDRRFDAPEWEHHPFFRLLKRSYVTIASQLLREAERGELTTADRRRLTFHLRQFVDATSPTLYLPTIRPHCARRWRQAVAASRMGCTTCWPIFAQGGSA